MTPEEKLARASLVFVGVIQKHQFDSWPLFRLNIPGDDPSNAKYWKILRREVRVETILRGVETRKVINIYEIFWTGGATGMWNSTHDGDRDLFLVRVENHRYHVVRDWRRSIYPVIGGPHSRLPLDDSRPLWERIALMNFWIERSDDAARITYPHFIYNDPGGVLSRWRTIKLERGLARHPSPGVRVPACRALLEEGGWGQDECWETLSDADRTHLHDGGAKCCSADDIAAGRRQLQKFGISMWTDADRENRRMLTAASNRQLRTEFCRLYAREYPGDQDTGCPADQPPPATIAKVRKAGQTRPAPISLPIPPTTLRSRRLMTASRLPVKLESTSF
jgi:hypothetical protein